MALIVDLNISVYIMDCKEMQEKEGTLIVRKLI
jgi:hypothetical protein